MARCTEDGQRKPSTPNSKEGEIPDTCKSLVYNSQLIAIAGDVCHQVYAPTLKISSKINLQLIFVTVLDTPLIVLGGGRNYFIIVI